MGEVRRTRTKGAAAGLAGGLVAAVLSGCSFFGGASAPQVKNWEPVLSPDRTKLAFETLAEKTYEIYARTLATGETVQLTKNLANDWSPSWSPQGDRLVFSSERNKNVDLYVVDLATLAETRLTDDPAEEVNPSWGADGRVYFNSNRSGAWEIYSVNGDGTDLTKITGASAPSQGG